ncbi:MAG: FadR family transcriptional regulator [Solirubrobacterales bacterium]|nr:FadR family transcriptional regulator [Solirubrobacterales bacterium]MCB8970597.1 FadR family transcriptional regulator [Thermoleophilales bacterium]
MPVRSHAGLRACRKPCVPPSRSPEISRLASAAVHQRLREQILGGTLAPGDPIPSERALSEELGVNRHAVREALKRLQQAGLVRISQGGATRVRDWRAEAGLEVLLDVVEQGSEPPAEMMRSVLEMRASIGTDAARRCADRAAAEQREAIRELASAVAEFVDSGGDEAVADFIRLWELIVDGSENLAYRLGLNSLNGALDAYPQIGEQLAPRDAAAVRALGEAIGAGEATAAADAARGLLEADTGLVG